MKTDKSIIILGHGSKEQEADETLKEVVEKLKNRLNNEMIVDRASLQFNQPTLEEQIEAHYKKGIRNMDILPFFLYEGHHVKVDIPREISKMKEKYPDLNINFKNPIGADERLVDIMLEKC